MLNHCKPLLLMLALLPAIHTANAQGTMYKRSGHYIALLDFFNNHPFKNEQGKIPHPLPETNGLLNTAGKWYEEKGIKVKGLLSTAALQVDWWTLFNEPTEQYEFQWTSSGRYDISFTDKKGKLVTATISRSMLEKYPDLLKRFDALQPTDIKFEIKWRIGSQTDADRDAFLRKYKLMGSIGDNMPHVKAGFKTLVKNGLLFEPAGKKPFSVPGIRPGKGQEFLGLQATYDNKKLGEIFDYWKISTGHVIQDFRATAIDWPVDEMKAIAEKFISYEKGETEPSPKEEIASANDKNRQTQPYAKDDFWKDAVEEDKAPHLDIFSAATGPFRFQEARFKIGNNTLPGLVIPNHINNDYNDYESDGSYNNIVVPQLQTGQASTDKDRRYTLGSLIGKYRKILGVFKSGEKAAPEFRVYDYKGSLVFNKQHGGVDGKTNSIYYTQYPYIRITYHYFNNTPFVLVAEWYTMNNQQFTTHAYMLNLETLATQELPIPDRSWLPYGAGIEIFDLSVVGEFTCRTSYNKNSTTTHITRKMTREWVRQSYFREPYTQHFNALFDQYNSATRYLICFYGAQKSDPPWRVHIYGISNDNKFKQLTSTTF